MKDEYLEFLDNLRESGITNTFGATPYIMQELGLEENESREVLRHWMKTFNERNGGGQ